VPLQDCPVIISRRVLSPVALLTGLVISLPVMHQQQSGKSPFLSSIVDVSSGTERYKFTIDMPPAITQFLLLLLSITYCVPILVTLIYWL
jgi:hypothetical protein